MEIELDPRKHERNVRERGLSFERAAELDFKTATTFPELRNGEKRLVSVGYLESRLHLICYAETNEGIRVISFGKVNQREAAKYGKPRTIDER